VGGEGCGVEVFGSVRERIGDGQRVQKLTPSAMGGQSPGYFLSYWGEDWLKGGPPSRLICAKSSFFAGWRGTSQAEDRMAWCWGGPIVSSLPMSLLLDEGRCCRGSDVNR
jgi:hypothetical protein